MIAIVDYGAGNIFSIKNALDFLGFKSILTSKASDIAGSDAVILPGVGAFPEAMNKLCKSGLSDTVKESAVKKPFLGICLGMQLIFDTGYEFEKTEGLSLIPGSIEKMEPEGLDIPHMGWNRLRIKNPCELTFGINEEFVYFVHSYKAHCDDRYISAYCEYGGEVPAIVSNGGTVFGTQFHPEKSGEAGLRILKNFGGLIK